MTERPWQVLAGLRPDNTKFPARANLEGEGIVILIANDTMVRCPLHVFTFKLSDGKGVNCPGFRLKVYEIKEENGVLFGRSVN